MLEKGIHREMAPTYPAYSPAAQVHPAEGRGSDGLYNGLQFPRKCSDRCRRSSCSVELSTTPKEDPMKDYIPLTTLNVTSGSRVSFGMHMPTRKNVIMKYVFGEGSRAEAEIMNRFPPHPRVVHVDKVVRVGAESWCLIFPYFNGGDLIDAVSPCAGVDEGKALKYFIQLMDALRHLHSYDIAHCDVKLDNLVLDDKGDLHLIDFGSAVCRSKECILACGGQSTLNYMAPEVHEGCCDLDHVDFRRCDVFSAGVVLFCLLVGCFPWCEADVRDGRYQRYVDAYPEVAGLCGWNRISASTLPMLLGMLHPDPEERWSSAQVLQYLNDTHPLTRGTCAAAVTPTAAQTNE